VLFLLLLLLLLLLRRRRHLRSFNSIQPLYEMNAGATAMSCNMQHAK